MTDRRAQGGDGRPESDAPPLDMAVGGHEDADLYVAVSEWLREAFLRVGTAEGLPPEERRRWQQRLVAITNTTKRDLARAREQTRHFDRDWETGPGPPATG